ncbi:hypothetical protein M8818_001084 [Zalaria obscura]|uniref:Uncharacterized protein n=1 Tax=Zalaria obscura TaxID=2024903 RepID=A0ACC3SLK4_9PEZI
MLKLLLGPHTVPLRRYAMASSHLMYTCSHGEEPTMPAQTPHKPRSFHAQPRCLIGLEPGNILQPAATQSSDYNDQEENQQRTPRHATRQAVSGKRLIDPSLFDTRYHKDLDRNKRTARARKHQNRYQGDSPAISVESDSDDDHLSDIDLSSGSGDDIGCSEDGITPTVRAPSKGSLRHSARSQAQKFVDYSVRNHPQDYGIPGYRRKRKLPIADADAPPRKKPRGRVQKTSDEKEVNMSGALPIEVVEVSSSPCSSTGENSAGDSLPPIVASPPEQRGEPVPFCQSSNASQDISEMSDKDDEPCDEEAPDVTPFRDIPSSDDEESMADDGEDPNKDLDDLLNSFQDVHTVAQGIPSDVLTSHTQSELATEAVRLSKTPQV